MRSTYILLNKLYETDKSMALLKIKEAKLDIPLCLQMLSRDFLKELGIWNDHIKSQIVKYNTSSYYTNFRIYNVEFRLLDLLTSYNLSFYTDKIDNLILMDFHMSMNNNYFNINPEPFFINLYKGRFITHDFMRMVKDYNRDLFYKFIIQSPEILKFILVNDQNLIDDRNFLKGLLGTDSNDIALLHIPYSEWKTYRKFITDEFIFKFYYKFTLPDLFLIRDPKFIWGLLKDQCYSVRYQMYSGLTSKDKVISVVRQDLKNLVKSNYKDIANKYKVHVIDTLSIIQEIISQILIFPILVDLTYLVISEMEDMAKDICMFYILQYISKRGDFVKGDSFCRWYLNIVKLLRLLYKDCDKKPLQDLVDLLLINNRYSAILLVEITGKCTLSNIEDVFLYEDYNIKLKEEIYERYQVIKKPKMTKCPLKYMTTLEVDKVANTLKCDSLEGDKVANTLKYMEDYLYVRNVARLISNNMDKIEDVNNLIEFFTKCCESREEDIRLIGNSMLSKIEIYRRK